MKKLLFCFILLFFSGCKSEYIVREDFPQAIMGTLPNGLDITQAESIISSMVILQKWNITDRAEGWMKIYKTVDFYDLYGSITYNENNYTISMDNVTSPVRQEYAVNHVWNNGVMVRDATGNETESWSTARIAYENKRSKLFNAQASKLARAIQKKVMQVDARAAKQREPAPIIINNNVTK